MIGKVFFSSSFLPKIFFFSFLFLPVCCLFVAGLLTLTTFF